MGPGCNKNLCPLTLVMVESDLPGLARVTPEGHHEQTDSHRPHTHLAHHGQAVAKRPLESQLDTPEEPTEDLPDDQKSGGP